MTALDDLRKQLQATQATAINSIEQKGMTAITESFQAEVSGGYRGNLEDSHYDFNLVNSDGSGTFAKVG